MKFMSEGKKGEAHKDVKVLLRLRGNMDIA